MYPNSADGFRTRLGAIEHEVMQYKANMAMAQQDVGGRSMVQTTSSSFMQGSGPSKEHQDLIDFNHKLMGMYSDLMNQHMTLMNNHQQALKHIKTQIKPAAGAGGNAGMAKAACLGVIRLDYDYPPAPGDIDCPKSFGYDVYYRVVPGLTFSMCQSGKMTAAAEQSFKEAVDWLIAKGVSGLTGDCGFLMYFQQLARRNCTKPVFMSSLAQLPAVTCAFNQHELVAIFTANSKTLAPMRDLIKDECGVDPEERRFVIVGCESVPGFEAVAEGGKVNVQKVTPGMVELAKSTLMKYPKIRAFLLECTELPPYADALRAATRLPVYDAITCCNFFIAGMQDNARFGINNWQKGWDGEQQNYTFGANLESEDRARLVNKIQD
jgi:hypothetical protein